MTIKATEAAPPTAATAKAGSGLGARPQKRPVKPAPSASFRLLVEYDGGRYHGWQRQGPGNIKTIAGSIDRALYEAGAKILNLMGAGRTDAGVHALGQVAVNAARVPGVRAAAP